MRTTETTVHRFHEYVAINPPTGSTFYLTVEEADQIMTVVGDFCADIETIKFTESTLTKQTITHPERP